MNSVVSYQFGGLSLEVGLGQLRRGGTGYVLQGSDERETRTVYYSKWWDLIGYRAEASLIDIQ